MRLQPPQAVAGRWTARQIHQTVADIVRQPKYAASRQSLAGRAVERVLRWVADLLAQMKTRPSLRYLLIAAAVAVLLIIVARMVVEQHMQRRAASGLRLRAVGGESRDYWALAAQLDASGKYVDACHAVYLAVLAALSQAGTLRFHTSKTSGDYARDLRQRGAPQSTAFAEFARDFERTVYGWSQPTHDDYFRLARAAEGFARHRSAA